MDPALRPMSTSQVLDRTFYLYRNNFVLFAGIAMVAPALALLAGLVQLWILGAPSAPKLESAGDPEVFYKFFTEFALRGAIQGLVSLIVYSAGTALAAGATMHAVSMVHLGKSTTIAESYAKIKPIFWKILRVVLAVLLIAITPLIATEGIAIGISIVQFRAMSAGGNPGAALLLLLALLFLLGGMLGSVVWLFYILCRYALAVPACVLEKLTARQALTRSRLLIKNNLGRILAVYLLTLLMSVVLTTLLQLPAYIAGDVFTLKPGMHMSAFTMTWLFAGEFLGKTLAGPVITIAIALVYYDQRIRKEAFDLQLMMEAMAQPSPQTMAAAVPPMAG
jgi:hypothetical protein